MQETNIVNGIVLRAERHKEADIKIHILTPTDVRVCYVTGVARQGAKMKSAVQLFTIAEFSLTGAKITGAHVLQTSIGIAGQINRYYLACAIAQVVVSLVYDSKNTADEGKVAQIFYLTARSFEMLERTQVSAYKILINFFLKLLIFLGYDTPDAVFLQKFKCVDDTDIDNVKLDHKNAKICVQILQKSYNEFLDISIPNIESFL